MAVERIIGIDFGTSTSVIRVKRYENERPIGEAWETKEVVFGGSGAMVPTLIMKKDDDPSAVYYGHEAQQKKRKFTNYSSFKVDLESTNAEKRAEARKLTEEFFAFMGKQYRAQSDGGHLGNADDKERTIISYPVKWSEETKRFMIAAAKKAGFPNVSGMDEAQAAIHAVTVMSTGHLQKHGLLQNGVASNILLIDMGAGTTDLVLCQYTPGSAEAPRILNTWPKSGKILFGGKEIDTLLKNFFWDKMDEADAQLVFKRIGTDKFKSWKEESVSPALRNNDSVSDFEVLDSCVDMMEIDMDEYCLNRAEFEKCLANYLKQFPVLINDCIHNSGIKGRDVDLVIVTGGHSQWYFVHDMLAGKMSQSGGVDLPSIKENPSRIIPITRPQETVALGLVYSPMQVVIDPAPPVVNDDAENSIAKNDSSVQAFPDTMQKANKSDKSETNAHIQIEDTFYLTGRGLVVTGLVRHGQIKKGEEVSIIGPKQQIIKACIDGIEKDGKLVDVAYPNNAVGLLLSNNIRKNDVEVGWLIMGTGFAYGESNQKLSNLPKPAPMPATPVTPKPPVTEYTPESEFTLGSIGENYYIQKYNGKRAVVSIPPVIRGRKVVAIGDQAFAGNYLQYGNKCIEEVIIPTTVTKIGMAAFANCSNLKKVEAHSGIMTIERCAFLACNQLHTMDFGMGCGGYKIVHFPKALQKIGSSAFSDRLGTGCILNEVTLSKSTKLKNLMGERPFPGKKCAIFYYD